MMLFFESFFQFVNPVAELLVCLGQVGHRLACVKHRGVILVAALEADDGQRRLGHLLGKIHGELASLDNFALAGVRLDAVDGDVEIVANDLLDIFDSDLAVGALDKFVHHLSGQFEGDVSVVEGGLSHEGNQSPFKFADIRVDVVSDVFDNFFGHFNAVVGELLAENAHAGFHIGRQQFGCQTPFEARGEASFKPLKFARSLVAGDDDLLAGLVQGVEDMED